jgi:hypothetical protein
VLPYDPFARTEAETGDLVLRETPGQTAALTPYLEVGDIVRALSYAARRPEEIDIPQQPRVMTSCLPESVRIGPLRGTGTQ